jgi:hypothetical protein
MPTTLSPTEQLTAAQQQFNTWYNQQIASGNSPTIGDANAQKAAILNSGAYPALDSGYAASQQISGSLSVNITPDQFFIVGQGAGYVEDRNNGYSGTPILSGGATTETTVEQVAAAQDAYQASLQAQQQALTTSSAQDAANAQAALSAAQARVSALQAQIDANPPPAETSPTSSQDFQTQSAAANNALGTPITPQDANPNSDIITAQTAAQNAADAAQASAIQNQQLAQQYALRASADTNTAQSSGTGPDITTVAPSVGFTTPPNPDITAVSPNTSFNTINGATEDGPNNPSVINSTPYTDVKSNTPDSLPSDITDFDQRITQGKALKQQQQNGSDSASITSSGKASGSQSPTTAVSNTSNSNIGNSTRPNKLHSYTNWTYRISLYGIPKETINQIYSKSVYPGNESVLMNGAQFICADGGSGIGIDRSYFPTDLTIDNLELETIVNTSGGRTRGTDVIKLKFDIIEPYTVNFLSRLQIMASSINPGGNWSSTFFVMKIEFLGYNDQGVPQSSNSNGDVIPGTTKFIPFTFVNMKFSVTASGGKYSCQGIPANAIGLTGLDNVIPFHAEFQAGTVKELFEAPTFTSTTTTTTGTGLDAREQPVTTTTQNTTDGSNTVVTKGIAAALNNSEQEKIKPENKGQKIANKYEFEFADEIGNAAIIDPAKFKEQAVANYGGKDLDAIKKGKIGSLTLSTDKNNFKASAGTKITDFIGSVITVSNYMTDQNTTSGHDTQVLKTWKITPVIQFNNIDPATNYYSRTVKYVVTPYMSYGNDATGFGQAPVSQNQIVKTYKYIYSGDNRDVIDASIDYNMAFFELKNGVPTNYTDKADDALGQNAQYAGGGYDGSTDNRFFKPRYQYLRGLANRQNTGSTTISGKAIAVQDLMEKLYDNRGDMIQLDFNIVGDPDWISQDYAIMHPSLIGNESFLKNGSVNYTNAVYFNFYFATPNTDYDDTSGLFNPAGNYSEFSGIYRVISVTSSFSNGKFTQRLKNVRVRNQNAPATTTVRSDPAANYGGYSGIPTSSSSGPIAEQATQTVVADNGAVRLGGTPTSAYSEDAAQTVNTGNVV